MRPAALILCAVVAVSDLGAQEQRPVFRARTDIVQLDVSVLDKKRRPVRGLKLSDFQVFEDNKPQELVAVSEIDLPDEYAETPVWAKAAGVDVSSNDVGDKRLFAIIVRTSALTTQSRPGQGAAPSGLLTLRRPDPGLVEAVSDMVHGIIDRLGPKDMAAILGSVCNTAFTDDRERLRRAIDSIQPGAPPCRSDFGRRSAGAFGRGGGPQGDLVEDVASYLSVVPQKRKAIIYIGDSYGAGTGSTYRDGNFRNAVWLAQMANVNIYTFSPYAVGARRTRTGRMPADGLKWLADETGGLAVTDPEKFEAGLDQLFTENGTYYMLGYKPTFPQMDGKFRKLSIKVKGRADLVVRSRPMWYRPKENTEERPTFAATPSIETAPRLYGLLPNLDVTFEATAVPFARPGAAPGVALLAEITEPLMPGTIRVAQKMDLRMLVYDDTGEVRKDTTVTASLDETPTLEDRVRYGVRSQFDLAAGRYSVRLVAHNAGTDKLGSTEFDIHVPDFTRDTVSLSGVAIVMPQQTPFTRFGRLNLWAAIEPTAQRAFTTSERATAHFQIYQGGENPLAPVSLMARVLNGRGESVMDVDRVLPANSFGSARSTTVTLDLPLEHLRAGAYLLTIEAALGPRRTPRRDVRFLVR